MTDLVTKMGRVSDDERRKRGVEAGREPNFLRVFGNLRELAKEEPSAPRT